MDYRPRFIVKQWSLTAAECYEKGCNCKLCYLSTMLETKCEMKKTVSELVKKFGKPDIEKLENEYPKGFTKH